MTDEADLFRKFDEDEFRAQLCRPPKPQPSVRYCSLAAFEAMTNHDDALRAEGWFKGPDDAAPRYYFVRPGIPELLAEERPDLWDLRRENGITIATPKREGEADQC